MYALYAIDLSDPSDSEIDVVGKFRNKRSLITFVIFMATVELNLINSIQTDCVDQCHHMTLEVKQNGFTGLIEKQYLQNYLLRHEGDKARDPKADDQKIAEVKRNIDQLNQKYNDLIEAIDSKLSKLLLENGIAINQTSPMNSKTPGNLIDRCSIMTLKIYHMAEQTQRTDVTSPHILQAEQKVARLTLQRNDLFNCLTVYSTLSLILKMAIGILRFIINLKCISTRH